jgi:DNA polymerase-3 subunit delta
MTFKTLKSEIEAGGKSPIYLFYGAEDYYIDQLVNIAEHNLLEEGLQAFNQSVMYGKETNARRVIDDISQFPMMAPKRVVILKEAQDMKGFNQLLPIIENPVPHGILVISYKSPKIDKRTKVGKSLISNAIVFESKPLHDNQIAPWIIDYAREEQITIDHQGAQLLAEFLGSDLSKISNELKKLKLNVGDQPITLEDIQDQIGVSKDFNVFELQNALGMRDVVNANRIINYFGNNPNSNPIQMTIASLFSFFTKLLITQQYSNESDQNLMKKLGLGSSFFVKQYRLGARNFQQNKIRRILQYLSLCDLESKGVGSRNKNQGEILKELVYFILH